MIDAVSAAPASRTRDTCSCGARALPSNADRPPQAPQPGERAPESANDRRQAETLLASFPGPATLHISRRKKLVSFAFCLGLLVFFAWLLFVDAGRSQCRAHDAVMIPISFVFFAAFTARALRSTRFSGQSAHPGGT